MDEKRLEAPDNKKEFEVIEGLSEEQRQVWEQIKAALECGDVETAEDLVDENESAQWRGLSDKAMIYAVQCGCMPYVEAHLEDYDFSDLYDMGLIDYAEGEMLDYLLDQGLCYDNEHYEKYPLAIDTTNAYIIAFRPEFQKEVFQKYLSENDLTEAEALAILKKGEHPDETPEEEEKRSDLAYACELLKFSVKRGKLTAEPFGDMDDEVDVFELQEFMENLGYEFCFEGDSWKMETNGVYFIDE